MFNKLLSEKTSTISIVIGIIIFILSFFAFIIFKVPENTGTLSDFIGGVVGSIWALAGVILFYAALKSQQEALKDQKESTKASIDAVKKQSESLELQIKEFELQRKELEETREVIKYQSETLELQRFENTFFNLLDLHRNVYKNAQIKASNKDLIGGFAIAHLWRVFRDDIFKHSKLDDIKNITNQFIAFTKEYDHVFSPYISTVLHILQLLDKIEIANKEFYMKIYGAQLTQTEKYILFYSGAHGSGNLLKPLLEKYHLLKLLDTTELFDPASWKLYDDSAFND